MQPGYQPAPTGERWNVNMPAVIGVVFVFLVGVVIWVIATSNSDDDSGSASPTETTPSSAAVDATTQPVVTEAPPSATTPPTTSPTPLPSTVPATEPTTTTATSAPTTAPAPATTAPGAADGAVPGDLAVAGRAMQQPPCDDSYITVLASAVGGQATGTSIAAVLDQYPGANYLRTDQSCSSLTPDVDGEPIYVVFLGPFAFDSDACAARVGGPEGAYARQLSNELSPDHFVSCA